METPLGGGAFRRCSDAPCDICAAKAPSKRIDAERLPTQKTLRQFEAEAVLIRHIVFFSARRPEDVAAIQAGLSKLAAIPHSSLFEVSLNTKVDPLSDEIDVVVYSEFADESALAAFKAHPTYAETTRNVRPMRELRYSADVVSDAA